MPHTRLLFILVLAAGLTVPLLGCSAQIPDRDGQIAGAVLAAPEELRADATVYGYDADGALVTIREGDGELVCLADDPTAEGFRVACYHRSLEPYMARGRALRAEGITGQDSIDRRHEEVEAGTLKLPEEPAMVYNLGGDSLDAATGAVQGRRVLYAVYMPYATAAGTGLPAQPAGPGMPWLMRAGTPTAHIMISPPSGSGQ